MKFKIFAVITFLLLSWGLYQGLWAAPQEQTMGEIQRIFYYHVPSAWTAFLCFLINFEASVLFLVRQKSFADRFIAALAWLTVVAGIALPIFVFPRLKAPPNAEASVSSGASLVILGAAYLLIRRFFNEKGRDALAVSTAEVGVVFCTVVLVTGPLWARPVWGIWWTWDARLTTTLVLWLIYVSYLLLRRYSAGSATPTLAAALAVFGFLDVPIVYMSIRWWRTQHPQPVIAGGQGSGLDPHMWQAVLWNWLAFSAFAVLLIWVRYRLERARQQLEEQHALQAVAQVQGRFS